MHFRFAGGNDLPLGEHFSPLYVWVMARMFPHSGHNNRSWRTPLLLLVCAVALSACFGRVPVVDPDPAAIEQAKKRGGSAIDPTHRDAGDLYALESGTVTRPPPIDSAFGSRPSGPPTQNLQQQARPAAAPKQVAAVDPKTGKKRIRAVAVLQVKGAPGDGNAELTEAMRDVLRNAGWPVRRKPGPDTLTVRGKVRIGSANGGKQPVQLAWTVTDPAGRVLGTIRQKNSVPAGLVDEGFGSNARHVAKAASSGIFDLVKKAKK